MARLQGRRGLSAVAAAIVAAGALSPVAVGLVGSSASATGCYDVSTTLKTEKGKAVWAPTGLSAGHYQKGGSQSFTYADGKLTAKMKGSADTAGGGGGLDFGVAQVSAKYDHTWNRSTTDTTSKTQSYTTNSPALPKSAYTRWTLYHKAYQFKYTATVFYNKAQCGVKKYHGVAVVPTTSWAESNLRWMVQYQSHPQQLR